MNIKLSTGRKLKLRPITRDAKDDFADSIQYNHVENKDGNWDKLDIKAPQKMITKWMRELISGGDFKKYTTTPDGIITDQCIDELDLVERSDFFAEVLKLVFGGNEIASDSSSTS
tara:strand:+ start:16261 stop:16605 length:345 start_codon:yes stop_codon:yes gene_type:complete